MADCSQLPLGSQERILCAAGLSGGANGSSTSLSTPASTWWKVIFGVIILAVLIDLEPKLGGWLLLLIVLGLALSPQARGIITGS